MKGPQKEFSIWNKKVNKKIAAIEIDADDFDKDKLVESISITFSNLNFVFLLSAQQQPTNKKSTLLRNERSFKRTRQWKKESIRALPITATMESV